MMRCLNYTSTKLLVLLTAPIIENIECQFENFAGHCRQSGPLGFSHLGTEAKSGITLRIHNLNMI